MVAKLIGFLSVSTAIGVSGTHARCSERRFSNLQFLASFASVLGLNTTRLVIAVYGHVKSQTKQRPSAYGKTERLSGSFPLSLLNYWGSSNPATSP